MKNLGKKLITLILTVSMFFGTGITNVFAFNLGGNSVALDDGLEEDVDVVKQMVDIYKLLYSDDDADKSIEKTRADITTNILKIFSPGEIDLINEINAKINPLLSEIITMIPKNDHLRVLTLSSGNTIEFIDGSIFDPAMNYKDSTGTPISNIDTINSINIEAVNLLKNYKTNTIEPIRNYLLDLSKIINIYIDNYGDILDPTSVPGLKKSITNNYDSDFLSLINNIDLTKITYGDDIENPVLDLSSAIDTSSLAPAVITKIGNLQSVLNSFVQINKNIKLFNDTKENFETNNDITNMNEYKKLIDKFNETTEKSFDGVDPNSFQLVLTDFYTKLGEKLDSALLNIKSDYDNITLNYVNDVEREISNNALNQLLLNKLFAVTTIVESTKITNTDFETFCTNFLDEYEKSKLSVDNTLAGLTINGIKLDVTLKSQTLYLPYEVTTLTIETILSSTKATISIVKPTSLVIGENSVKITVTSESGSSKEYTVIVVRKEEEKKVEMVTYVNNTTISSNDNSGTDLSTIEIDNEKDKYKDNEVIEEKLNGWTVLLIVAGIGLISFGVYLLFGDKTTPLIVKKEVIKPRNIKKSSVTKSNKPINKTTKKRK